MLSEDARNEGEGASIVQVRESVQYEIDLSLQLVANARVEVIGVSLFEVHKRGRT